MTDLAALVPPLLELCREAGQLITAHYHGSGADEYEAKGDDSPLTQADLVSHHCLEAGLQRLTPDIPILSEESTVEAVAERRLWSELWLVDPLDGTKEFLGRTGEFTINIALIRAGEPVLGVIYLPLDDLAYFLNCRFRVLQQMAAGVAHFTQIMGRDIGCHAHGNARSAIEQ